MNRFFFIVFSVFSGALFAQPGKDGNRTITSPSTQVNTITALSANANAGSSSIQVVQSGLVSNGIFSVPLSAGDLIMIFQPAGATVSGSFYPSGGNTYGLPKDSLWGSVVSYNGAGNYEWQTVSSVLGNTINLNCPLQKSYTTSGKSFVIRIPRFLNLTVNSGASITCATWSGLGGVIAIEVSGNCMINGTIDASRRGFRGGMAVTNSSFNGSGEVATTDASMGARRGEGIAGFETELNYVGGMYGKGAAANAGGGGTSQNAGGGGGGNGGNPNNYNGYGVPDVSNASWLPAWNLLSPGLSGITSSGGGVGGLSASTSNQNALTIAPGASAWSGDFRRRQGGFGGRPLDYANGRIFFGGGGGAGQRDNAPTGDMSGKGGNGGGIVNIYCSGSISGSGSILANGENGTNAEWTQTFSNTGDDGAGGGGAGGTIFLDGTTNISGISLQAIGGNGGNQNLQNTPLSPNFKIQAHGPGGGGSGGYVNLPIALTTVNVNGGNNGTTNSTGLSEFPPNGACKGGVGTVNQFQAVQFVLQNDTVCPGQNAVLTVTGPVGSTYSYDWYDAAIGGNFLGTGNSFTTPPINTTTDYYVQPCPFHFRLKLTATLIGANLTNIAGSDQQTCSSQVALNATLPPASSGAWTVFQGNGNFSDNTNPLANASSLGMGINRFVWTVSGNGCVLGSDTVNITRLDTAVAALAGSDQTVCGFSVSLSGNNPAGMISQWNVLSGSNAVLSSPNTFSTSANNLSVGVNLFEYTLSPGNACPVSRDTVQITSIIPPSPAVAGTDQSVCAGSVTLNGQTTSIGNPQWSVLSGSGTFVDATSVVTQVNGLSPGPNLFLLTISQNNCASSFDTVVITRISSPPPANAGNNASVCGSSYTLQASATGSATGSWSMLSGSGDILNGNSPNALVSNLSQGNVSLLWTVSLPGCPSTSDTVNLSVVFPQIPEAGSNRTVCSDTIQLGGNSINASWSSNSVTALIASPAQHDAMVTSLLPGNHTFYWTTSPGICPSLTDSVLIQVLAQPLAIASPDTAICGSVLNLQAQPVSGAVGAWSVLQGGSALSGSGASVTANNLSEGTNRFVWQVSLAGCQPVSDTVVVQASLPPTVAVAGEHDTICGTQIALLGNVPLSGTGSWSAITNGALVSGNQASFALPGLYQLEYVISSGICIPSRDTLLVLVYPALQPFAGSDKIICSDTLTLQGTSNAGVLSWSSLSGGNITVIGNGRIRVNNIPTGTGSYVLYSNLQGCAQRTDTVRITRNQAVQALAGDDAFACGLRYTMNALLQAGSQGVWIVPQGMSVTALNDPNAGISVADSGKYRLYWQVSQAGCAPATDTVDVTFFGDKPTTRATADTVLVLGDSIQLNIPGAVIANWSPGSSLTCTSCLSPIASPLSDETYLLTYTDARGCIFEDTVEVKVNKNNYALLPDAFSPNGDDTNDYLFVRHNGLKDIELYIYSEFGEEVFRIQGIQAADQRWDGTLRGKTLMPQVLVYMMQGKFLDGKSFLKEGRIMLMR
ncbi:MAG: gliding motility-associated C-terminal domain-containing protein [Bacteroidota bacterium]